MNYTFYNNRGFSTLMALGTIGVLLIIVTGLASTYIRENKLSRTSYDEVIAYANAEGMFEYAMLKVRNHREGFDDSVENSDLDGQMFVPTKERSKELKSGYTISASSKDKTFLLKKNDHLIVPLFSSTGSYVSGLSKNPNPETGVQKVDGLEVTGMPNLSWTIVAMSGSESVGLTGSGDIDSTAVGTLRLKGLKCLKGDGTEELINIYGYCPLTTYTHTDGTVVAGESLEYYYDYKLNILDFLKSDGSDFLVDKDDPTRRIKMSIQDPYLMVFNDSTSDKNIGIKSSTPFALPTLSVRAQAQKNDSVQVFEFTEDKSRYYDVLKYGVYNAD